ncbi:MAG: GMC family oxidoreductase N-terminal domain-containing protein [Thermoleophilaceae bacterium]
MSGALRPTTGDVYHEPWTYQPREVRVVPGDEVTSDRTVRADVCVIGTGAGGAPVAKELAEGGMAVVVLESGDRFTTDDYNARPREMTSLLYRDAGQTVTIGNVPIVLPMGEAVAGSTLINSGTCFRTPDVILESWGERFGLDALSPDELDPFFRRVEREIHVVQVPEELAGNNALVIKRGADKLGWSGDFIFRNASGCVGSGVCNWGCPTSAKLHMGLTYMPRAWDAGATTYTLCRADKLDVAGGRLRAVEARAKGRGRLRVECDTVVVAGGAIHSPLLLERNKLGLESGELCNNLALHPAAGVRARFDEEINMARGVPQSYYVDEFCDEGIMFEGAAGPPDYAAMSFPFSREAHRGLMLDYLHLAQFGLMVSDTSRGSVRPLPGSSFRMSYALNDEDLRTFKRGIELLVECYWAAGAQEVYPPVEGIGILRDGDTDTLRRHDTQARDLTLAAFHPLGTARADAREDHGVVDGDLKLHGVDGVYVCDGSVVPSSIGVNPQITIMALATRLAYHLLDKPAPVDEPEPEKIARPRIRKVHAVTA